jgi:type II secretion system protein H
VRTSRRPASSQASPSPSPFGRCTGFTLLEILVVVAILGLAAAVAVASLDRDERGTLDREARRFAGALEYAAQRAQLRHETLGVSAGERGWRFWSRAPDGRWRAIAGDDALAARALPEPLAVAPLGYAGQPLPAEAIVPLRASGRNEPYSFALSGATFQATVSADPLNRVSVTGPAPIAR